MSKPLFDGATNDSVTVGTSSTEILAKNAVREYALIVNDSNEVIYLAFGADAVLNKGCRLSASGGKHEITSLNMFTGAVNGISTSGSKNVTIIYA